MQAKRIQIAESNDGVGAQTTAILEVPTDPRQEVNMHNIWWSVSSEPQDAAANAQGTWLLYIIKENTTGPVFTDVVVNGESRNAEIIALGIFSTSNESPYNSGPLQIKSSRTLQAGDKLAMTVITTGITAGLASNRVCLSAHVTRK